MEQMVSTPVRMTWIMLIVLECTVKHTITGFTVLAKLVPPVPTTNPGVILGGDVVEGPVVVAAPNGKNQWYDHKRTMVMIYPGRSRLAVIIAT